MEENNNNNDLTIKCILCNQPVLEQSPKYEKPIMIHIHES